jgi:DNA mismatch repair protein MutS2
VRAFSAIGAEWKRLKTGGLLSPGELLRVNSVLKAAKHAAPLAREGDTPIVAGLAASLFFDEAVIRRIDECILSETEIADTASSELARIRRAIRQEHDRIRERLQSMIRSQSNGKYLQDAIVTQRNGRFVVPVKAEHKGNVPGIVHERSASGATLFVEPESVVEANNRIRELEGAGAAEIARILAELSALAGGLRDALREDARVLAELDLLFAKALLARDMRAHPVEFNNQNIIRITEGRHPLIDADRVTPVTVNMNDGVSALIVTGPNTGGKTVTLKLVGLFCVMAQAGLFIPAQPVVSLPVFDSFFADIGDEQSIEQSLSTFSAHMKSIIFAVKHAGSRSLALLDELGAGTDPQEGSALAQAVLTHLHEKGCMLIATTHIGELKVFAVKNAGFENASMEFDAATLTPTYHLIMGVAGKSNALTISKSLGLPGGIVRAAQGFMQSEAVEYDRLLERAQKDRAKAAADLKKAGKLLDEARREKERATRIAEKAAEKRKRALEQANEKAIEIIDDAKRTAEEAISAAKKLDGQPEAERTRRTKAVRDTLSVKRQYIPNHDTIQKKKTQ